MGSERARNVLRWIDWCVPERVERYPKRCCGRKDVERFRANLRICRYPEDEVRVLTEAAQHKDIQFLLRFEFNLIGGVA